MPHDVCTPAGRPPGGFAPGTRLITPEGAVAVETLRAGDLVLTRDSGPCRLASVFRRDAPSAAGLVCIAPGALGPDVPETALTVVAEQRMLMVSDDTLRLFGTAETLVAAGDLAASAVADWTPERTGHLVTLDLGRAELVLADGAWAKLGADLDAPPGSPKVLSPQDIRIASL